MTQETIPLHLTPCLYRETVDGFECVCIGGKLSIDGQGNLPHGACQGTGYQYPALRKVCSWNDHNACVRFGSDDESHCDGTGTIPNYTTDALLEAIIQAGWDLELFNTSAQSLREVPDIEPWTASIWPREEGTDRLEDMGSWDIGFGHTPAEALKDAIEIATVSQRRGSNYES
jgi:hypothetical protein